MPSSWSAKDERQYKHILTSCKKRSRRSKSAISRCKSIAAATVNKVRARRLGKCVCPKGYNKRGRACFKRKGARVSGPKKRRMVCKSRRRRR